MSKNKELINLLKKIKYKSVSKQDMKYNKVFKEYSIDSLIEHNAFANKIRKKWEDSDSYNNSNSKVRTTNDKLKQIINSNKNASKIQDIFFKTFDKEPLFKKIIKKENEKSKKKINSNDISEKIKIMLENRKKFNVSNTFLKRRKEENNRCPPLCLYSPKYNYIYKHVPGFHFHNEIKTKRKKIIIQDKDNTNKSKESINVEKNKSIYSFKKINNSLTPLHLSNNRSHISFISNSFKNKSKETEENKNFSFNKFQKNFFLSQQCSPVNNEMENKVQFDYSPKYIKKNILIPNFDKMMPRFEKPKKSSLKSNADYSPNYNAVFSGVLNNKPIDYEKRRKYKNLKKIITIYNPTAEYLLFPQLNPKE